MTDYVLPLAAFPAEHYGAHFVGTRATFCLPADLANMDANVLAIPGLGVRQLTTSPVTVDPSFFGMGIQNRRNDAVGDISFYSIRSHDIEGAKSFWFRMEPSDNTWDFSGVDDWVNAHYQAGRDLVFVLYGTPTWASSNPTQEGASGAGAKGAQAIPTDMTKWDRFCTKVATRYLGKIKYYEVWNEPNLNADGLGGVDGTTFFFSGTFAQLSQLVRRANQAIKAVDPTAKIVSPAITQWSTSSGGDAEDYFIAMMNASSGDAGNTPMKDWIDIVGVHLYGWERNGANVAGMIDRINAAKSTIGISSKETWDTESAPIFPFASDFTDDELSRLISRAWITMAACGIKRTFWYQYDGGDMYIMGRPHPIARVNALQSLLTSGQITAAAKFTDGRIAYTTAEGLTII